MLAAIGWVGIVASMCHHRCLGAACLLGLSLARTLAAQSPSDPAPIEVGQTQVFASEVLGDRRIRIALPEGYERSTQPCGVIYLLDGQSHFLAAVAATRHLSDRGFPPLIVVGIDAQDTRTRDLTPVGGESESARFPTSGGAEAFRRFLVDELRPMVDKTYRTGGFRALIGHSFGGLFAVDTLLREPDAFCAYLVLSPSLWWHDERLIDGLLEADRNHGMFDAYVYWSMGDEGIEMNPPFERAVRGLEGRAPAGFRWDVRRLEGEDHWSVAIPSLYDGLRKLLAPMEAVTKGVETFDELVGRLEGLSQAYRMEIPIAQGPVIGAARHLERAGKAEAAIALLGDGIERLPQAAMLYYVRGQMQEKAGTLQQALATYSAGVEAMQGHPDAPRSVPVLTVQRDRVRALVEASVDRGKG